MSRTKDVVKTHQTRVSPLSKKHQLFCLKHKISSSTDPSHPTKTPNKNTGEKVFGPCKPSLRRCESRRGVPQMTMTWIWIPPQTIEKLY